MKHQIKAGICGINGYSGQELANLSRLHPHFQLCVSFMRDQGALPYQFSGLATAPIEAISDWQDQLDIVFLATPADVSLALLSQIDLAKIKVIDLSGAMRLPAATYEHWYQMAHTQAPLLAKTSYGLVPWDCPKTQLVANPGCYATCALMSLLPLIKANIIDTSHIIIDAKSGASGAGKKPNSDLMLSELANNFYAYSIGTHRHQPEIQHSIANLTDVSCELALTTQLLPIVRGISMSIYADSKVTDPQALASAYHTAYQDYPLVAHCDLTQTNKATHLLQLKNVVSTPMTHIVYTMKAGKISIFASIDNLLKGAASQAMENANLLFDLSTTMGLITGDGS